MRTIVTIVEGDGEVRALPVLLRRLAESRGLFDLQVPTPIRVHRDQFIRRDDEFRRKLLLAEAKAAGGKILILLDSDDDCPKELGADLLRRAQKILPNSDIGVVLAHREYEAWFLASAESIAGKRGLPANLVAPLDPESIRNAKGWLSERVPHGKYHEVVDQPALSAIFDLEKTYAKSRSFRKLVKECSSAFEMQ